MSTDNGSGNGQPGGAGAAGEGAPAPWYGADAAPEIKGFVELKGWDTPDKAVDSYRNLESLLGADRAGRTVVLPKDEADVDSLNAILGKLGRPDKVEDYGIKPPEGDDGKFLEQALPVLHKLGLTKKQATELAAWWDQAQTGEVQRLTATAQAEAQQQEQALRGEWGGQFDANVLAGQKAAQALGVDAETISDIEAALGYGRTMKLFQAIGTKLGEDSFVGGTPGASGPMSVEAAKVRLEQLGSDKAWLDKWVAGDAAARAEKDRLDQILASRRAA